MVTREEITMYAFKWLLAFMFAIVLCCISVPDADAQLQFKYPKQTERPVDRVMNKRKKDKGIRRTTIYKESGKPQVVITETIYEKRTSK